METIKERYDAMKRTTQSLVRGNIIYYAECTSAEAEAYINEPHKAPPAAVRVLNMCFPDIEITKPENETE